MSLAELLRIALRYTLALGRGHLSVFMAGVSILGLVLGTGLLLTVLSVMNGFEREMRERILALVPHATIHLPASARDVAAFSEALESLEGLRSSTPFVSFDAMALQGSEVSAVTGLGLDKLPPVTPQLAALPALDSLDGMVLGDSVAERLGLIKGDSLSLIVLPSGAVNSAALKTTRQRLAAVIDTGTELDESLALLPLAAASELAGLDGGISGVQLRFDDPFRADAYLREIQPLLVPGSYATSWRMTHGNLWSAIQLSRDLVVLLLTSIIAVAAFNVVSALVLIVIDQRGAIAILRTLGATPTEMAILFVFQGLIIGVLGASLGCALGALLCAALPDLVAALENALGFRFLSTDVYPVSFIPVDLRLGDVALLAGTAVFMCILAALYPALRAARLAPASVLHQDA